MKNEVTICLAIIVFNVPHIVSWKKPMSRLLIQMFLFRSYRWRMATHEKLTLLTWIASKRCKLITHTVPYYAYLRFTNFILFFHVFVAWMFPFSTQPQWLDFELACGTFWRTHSSISIGKWTNFQFRSIQTNNNMIQTKEWREISVSHSTTAVAASFRNRSF